jgi:hypothetical protein
MSCNACHFKPNCQVIGSYLDVTLAFTSLVFVIYHPFLVRHGVMPHYKCLTHNVLVFSLLPRRFFFENMLSFFFSESRSSIQLGVCWKQRERDTLTP